MSDLKDSTKKIGDAIAREAEDVGDAFKSAGQTVSDLQHREPKTKAMVIGFGVVFVILVVLAIAYG